MFYISANINKKIHELLDKMDETLLKKKINNALLMLKDDQYEELAQKLNSIDKTEFLEKMGQLDKEKLSNLNINFEEVKNKLDEKELKKIADLIGENGDEIVNKFKAIMKE